MKTIFKIDDVEYIRKDEYDKVKNDLDKIKATIRTSFDELKVLMDAGLVETSVKITEKPIEQIESVKFKSSNRKSKNAPYETPEYGQSIWQITKIDKEGNLFNKGRKLKIHIKHVLKAQASIRRNMTFGDFAELKDALDLDYQLTHRLIYNIQHGVFIPYVKEWNRMTQPKIGMQHRTIQNNPEKRKEMGYC